MGIIKNPFGTALCLLLVGLFFAHKLYCLHVLTFGDFYKVRYNRPLSMLAGMGIWLEGLALNTTINPLIYSLLASILGLIMGLLLLSDFRKAAVK